MTKEEMILDLIVQASKALIDSNVLIYPAGSLSKLERYKCKSKLEYNEIADNKPEFLDINNYRGSLLALIEELKNLYVIKIREDV